MAVLVAHEEGTISLDDAATAEGASVADLLAHAGGVAPDVAEPLTTPRSRRIYSTAAYDIVADRVAAAADMPFPRYVASAVCEPLGMTSTVLGASAGADARGSANDLVRLMGAWRAPLLVDRSTLERATTPHLALLSGVLPGYGRQEPNLWGLGPELRGTKDPHWGGSRTSPATFGHFGRSGTLWWLDPEADRGVVALTDEPFGHWAIDAWPPLADAILSF
jgi:CubicO group peptidase (beta-lactamase class C family)